MNICAIGSMRIDKSIPKWFWGLCNEGTVGDGMMRQWDDEIEGQRLGTGEICKLFKIYHAQFAAKFTDIIFYLNTTLKRWTLNAIDILLHKRLVDTRSTSHLADIELRKCVE